MHIMYQIELVVFLVMHTLLAVCFLLINCKPMFAGESFKNLFYVLNIRKSCKVFGFMANTAFLIKSLDPHGLYGLFSYRALSFMSYGGIGCIVMAYIMFASVSFVVNANIKAEGKFDMKRFCALACLPYLGSVLVMCFNRSYIPGRFIIRSF